MDDVCALQTVELLLIPGKADAFLIFGRKFVLQAILHISWLLVMIRQHLIVELANTFLVLADLNSFLLFFFIQRYNFIPERSNCAALFV